MSLLIFGSANRVAQGVIKRLYGAGTYERIVCADLYPNYWAHEKFLNFKGELETVQSNTKLSDIKISERSDLAVAVKNASHVVYITHDYYSAVSSKLNLIKVTAELATKYKVKSLVALTPVEHDHYNEENPYHVVAQSEKEALNAYNGLVHLKSDITFGHHSTVVEQIIGRFINQESFYFDSRNSGQLTRPIHGDDVAEIVDTVLRDQTHAGKAYALEGPDAVTLDSLIRTLERHIGGKQNVNDDLLEKIISPTSVNLLTERLYTPCYINLASFLKLYKPLQGLPKWANSANLRKLDATYPAERVDRQRYRFDDTSFSRSIKQSLY